MAKKDKKKKADDGPVQEVTGVNWMDAQPDEFMGGMFPGDLNDEEEEEEDERPKKGKAKANKQDKGKGKSKKGNNDPPATSGWDEPTAAPAVGASSGWGDPQSQWHGGTDTAWDQPAASTSQTPYGSLGGMNLPVPTAGQWGAYSQQPQTPAPPANPYATAAPMNPYAGQAWSQPSMLGLSNHAARGMHTPAAHQMWIPPMTEADYDDDEEDALAAVNQAAQFAAKKNKGKQKDKENQNQKKGKKQQKQQQQQETTPGWGRSPHTSVHNDWSSEPPPLAPANDWSQPEPPRGKKGKQRGYQQPAPDAADALFAGGYPAYYTPNNSHTLGYAGATPQPSAYDGAFAVTPTGNHALQEAGQALFGRHRPSIQRILWQMPPHHDHRVRDVMEYIQNPAVKMELTAIALRHFVSEREPGCFFVNATYRLPDKPNTPGFDWLRLSELVNTYDRIIQQSLLYYQPLEHALVFVFLVSHTGNSMACWRRKLPIHQSQVAQYQHEVSLVKREIAQQEHHIFVDSPPLDHFTGFPFSPAVGGHAWGGGTSMYGATSPAPPPEKKVKSGWSWLRR